MEKKRFSDVDKSLYEFQKQYTKDYHKEDAFYYYKRNMSYKKSQQQIEDIAKVMIENNVQKAETVAVISPTLPEVINSFYAINKIGGIFFPIDPRVNPKRMRDFLNFTETKKVIMFDQVFGKLDAIIDQTNIENVIVISAMNSMFPFLKWSYHYQQMNQVKTYNRAVEELGTDDPVQITQIKKHVENLNSLLGIETEQKNSSSRQRLLRNIHLYQTTRDTALKNMYYTKQSKTGYMSLQDAILDASYLPDSASVYDPSIPATLTFTSGTTGSPKLVPTKSRSYNVRVRDYAATTMPIEKGDRMVGMPSFLMYGEVFMHMAYVMGVQNVIVPDLINQYYPDVIRKNRVSHAVGVPAHGLELARDKKFNSKPQKYLKTVSVGGGPLLKEHEQEMNSAFEKNGIKVTQGYSMTELTPSSTTNMPGSTKLGSAGKILGNTRTMVVDPDTLKPLAPNEKGTLLVHNEAQFEGYYKNEEATKHVFIEKDGIKWVNTEDKAYIDEEGYHFIVGRYKDMISPPGLPHNIFPKDLEEALIKCPIVKDCSVVGRPWPDYEHPQGQQPKAHIVLIDEFKSDPIVSEAYIREFAKMNLPENEVPYFYAFHDELPLTPVLKPDKEALKEWDKEQFELEQKGKSKVK